MKNIKLAGTFFVQTAQEEGKQGPRGMLPYPAGEYSSSTKYVATANIAPYIVFSGKHYVMNKIGTWLGTSTGKTPAQDYATNGVNATWIPFEDFKAIFVEILMARLGLIGAAVFYDDCMFSQQGIDANGNPSSNYHLYGTANFTPNVLINFKTGEGHLGAGGIKFKGKDIEVVGKYSSTSLFGRKIEIDPYYNALRMYDYDGNKIAELTGQASGTNLDLRYYDGNREIKYCRLSPSELFIRYTPINGGQSSIRLNPDGFSSEFEFHYYVNGVQKVFTGSSAATNGFRFYSNDWHSTGTPKTGKTQVQADGTIKIMPMNA